ncbi:DnaJ domain-containing protein [Sporodiniella umbellata]|nr:DnaJ domain-containing protein [Sporodiniella umbellata]
MEINKEEAIRCLTIAKNQYGNKNYEAALRLTKKSIKLYPTQEAREFLAKAELSAASGGSDEKKQQPEKPMNSSSKPASKSSSAQSQDVREILACGTDYYKVLKLDKKCTEVEIKKSYRKLALKFHPDKNKTTGADEAFKLISKAFTVLSDPQKRAVHDAGGGDPEQRGSGGFSNFRAQNFGASPFGEEVSPEELFNMFFGGGMGRGASFNFGGGPSGFSSATFVGPGFRARTFNTAGGPRQAQQQRTGWSIFLQILPLLFLFGYTILSGLFTEDVPNFAFQSSSVYSHPRMTSHHQVRYYVNPSTFRPYQENRNSLSKFEYQVEKDWVQTLQQRCYIERKQRQNLLEKSRGTFGFLNRNEKLYQEALNMELKNCNEIKKFGFYK